VLEAGDADLILNIPPEDITRRRNDPRFAIESIPTALEEKIRYRPRDQDDPRAHH